MSVQADVELRLVSRLRCLASSPNHEEPSLLAGAEVPQGVVGHCLDELDLARVTYREAANEKAGEHRIPLDEKSCSCPTARPRYQTFPRPVGLKILMYVLYN